MTTHLNPVELEQVSCEICMKEVPLTEAMVPEAEGYFVHFCGLDCYQQWKSRSEESDKEASKPESK
jgi:hypothetical protein